MIKMTKHENVDGFSYRIIADELYPEEMSREIDISLSDGLYGHNIRFYFSRWSEEDLSCVNELTALINDLTEARDFLESGTKMNWPDK